MCWYQPWRRRAGRVVIASAVLLAGLAAAGCEEGLFEIAEGEQDDAVGAQSEPLPPVLAAYGSLWANWDAQGAFTLVHLIPLEARLRMDDSAPPGERERLIAWLEKSQDLVVELIEVSRRPMEQFPSELLASANDREGRPAGHPRTWMQNFEVLLAADASRLLEIGDDSGAAERMAAILRIAHGMVSQEAPMPRLSGGVVLLKGLRKSVAMVEEGMLEQASAAAVQSLRMAVEMLDPKDPSRAAAAWEGDARRQAAGWRAMLAGDNAGDVLAEYLEQYGLDQDAISDMMQLPAARGLHDAFPLKSAARPVRRMPARQIHFKLAEAEAMIPEVGRILRGEAPEGGLSGIMQRVREDPTQLARLIIGAPGATREDQATMAADLRVLRELLGAE